MRLDLKHMVYVTSESAPGCYGDSCANTARYGLLVTNTVMSTSINLAVFRTDKGYLRHPDSPWRENDMSSDQCLPLLMAYEADVARYPGLAVEMRSRIALRTGNGNLSSLGLMATARRLYVVLALINILSAVVFKLPFRYNDEKRRFERTANNQNAGDYLNWFAVVNFLFLLKKPRLCKIARMFVSKEEVMSKINFYYRNEPDVDMLLHAYDFMITDVLSN